MDFLPRRQTRRRRCTHQSTPAPRCTTHSRLSLSSSANAPNRAPCNDMRNARRASEAGIPRPASLVCDVRMRVDSTLYHTRARMGRGGAPGAIVV